MSDWFLIRRQARRDVHAAFAYSAQYVDSTLSQPVDVTVRWLNQLGLPVGDISGGDYAQIADSIDRVRFNVEELAEKSVKPRRGGRVTVSDYDVTFILHNEQPSDGPVTQTWTVTK